MLLHAEGDSMINAGIFNGDLVVANVCNNAKDGDIVVALIDDSAQLKDYTKEMDIIFYTLKILTIKI